MYEGGDWGRPEAPKVIQDKATSNSTLPGTKGFCICYLFVVIFLGGGKGGIKFYNM